MSHSRNKIARIWLYFQIRDKRKNHLYSYVIGVFIAFFIYWLFAWSISDDRAEAGTFGDQFGGLNAIISGLAFVGLFISLQLQRNELRLQRHDLKLQREEMKKSREEAEEQTQQFKIQVQIGKEAQFRDDFYRRLELLQTLSNNVIYHHSSVEPINTSTPSGILAWQNIYLEMTKLISMESPCQASAELCALLTPIVAWHRFLVNTLDDTIRHHSGENATDAESETLAQYIHIILNSLTEFQRDFFVFFLDVRNDKTCSEIKKYLYNEKYIDDNLIKNLIFSHEAPNRTHTINDLRNVFPS